MLKPAMPSGIAGGLLLALSLIPAPSSAQMVLDGPRIIAEDTRADGLERRARALHEQPGRYLEAAQLYLRSADLRRTGDPRILDALFFASRLYHHAGKAEESVIVLRRFADTALACGDLIRAADALIDAAWILAQNHEREEAAILVERAQLLIGSPLLREGERATLLARLGRTG